MLLNIAKKNVNLRSNVKIKFVKDRPGHDIRYALNSKKIKKEIRWNFKNRFKEGLRENFFMVSK